MGDFRKGLASQEMQWSFLHGRVEAEEVLDTDRTSVLSSLAGTFPGGGHYAPQSGEIVGMKDEMTTDLDTDSDGKVSHEISDVMEGPVSLVTSLCMRSRGRTSMQMVSWTRWTLTRRSSTMAVRSNCWVSCTLFRVALGKQQHSSTASSGNNHGRKKRRAEQREKGRKGEGVRGQEVRKKEEERKAEEECEEKVKKDVTGWIVVSRSKKQKKMIQIYVKVNGGKVVPTEVNLTDDKVENVVRLIQKDEDMYVTMHGRVLKREAEELWSY